MIKGCNKRVIVMKDTGDSVFEQAFFILKPGVENKSQSDILVQAQKIIENRENSNFPSGIVYNADKKNGKSRKSMVMFFLGLVIGVGTSFLLMPVI